MPKFEDPYDGIMDVMTQTMAIAASHEGRIVDSANLRVKAN